MFPQAPQSVGEPPPICVEGMCLVDGKANFFLFV